MSILSCPSEIILLIADGLGPKELSAFLRANHRFYSLLTQKLHTFAIQDHGGLPALHWAANNGHEPLVRLLLQKGFDASKLRNTYLGEGTAAIHLAASNGEVNVVKALLDVGEDVNAVSSIGRTPLYFAALAGKELVVRLLIENGAIKSHPNFDGSPALVQAVCCDHKPVVRLLLEKGVSVNARGVYQATVLHLAIAYKLESMAELLLDSGADIGARDYSECTPVHWAIEHGQENILKGLLARGADPNAQNSDGDTPLHRAVIWGSEVGTKILLEKADITVRNYRDQMAIQLAEWRGKASIFTSIIAKAREKGILEDMWDTTELFHLATGQGWDEIVRRLLEEGIDIDLRCNDRFALNRNGLTALMIAATHGCESTVKLLLEYGADANLKGRCGGTAFDRAVKYNHGSIASLLVEETDIGKDIFENLLLHATTANRYVNIIKLVIEKHPQIDVDHRDHAGQTMLHRRSAVGSLQDEVINLLLEKGADINALDSRGETPLHKAAQTGADCCKLLLDRGADITIQSHKGFTALNFAKKLQPRLNTTRRTIQLLLEAQEASETSSKRQQ